MLKTVGNDRKKHRRKSEEQKPGLSYAVRQDQV